MRHLRYLIPLLLTLFVSSEAFAQFRNRDNDRARSSRTERPSSRKRQSSTGDASLKAIIDRSWVGASASLSFFGNGGFNQTTLGISPMVGYKVTPWLSAGPRFSVLYNGVKGRTSAGTQRVNLWDFGGGAFVRTKVYMFYAQAEFTSLSQQNFFVSGGQIAIDPATSEPRRERTSDQELLVGIGYNPGGGGVGSDIGIFYNLFDNVESQRSAITFRVMLTFGY